MKTLLTYSLLFVSFWAVAQKKDRHLAKGNAELKAKQYAEAEAEYRLSQNVAPGKVPATYNLANTIYTMNLPEEAGYVYLKAIKEAKTYTQKHQAYHNMGNAMMKLKNYQGAVEAYKQALVNNPNDEQTRYNYALARLYLKNNPPKGGKDDKKDQKKDQNKKDQQKQDQQNKQDKKDQGDQNKDQQKKPGDKQKDKGEGDQPKPQPRPQGASKQRIENILNAINNEEKKVQDKVKEKAKAQPVQPEKDW